jgi:hypothetical protein
LDSRFVPEKEIEQRTNAAAATQRAIKPTTATAF